MNRSLLWIGLGLLLGALSGAGAKYASRQWDMDKHEFRDRYDWDADRTDTGLWALIVAVFGALLAAGIDRVSDR